ncbi:MAG: outer membrane lipoprotein carrier protein LolA [Acidobacteria bacterium]|nr:outer membrane lipoprotein carrier protein LolA [Acidobacteriota bacterium]
MKKIIPSIVIILICLPGMWLAADNSKLKRVLDKLDHLNSEVQTFQAELIQTKWIKLLQEMDEPEKGKILFKKIPGGFLLRKEIEEPGNTILVVSPDEIIIYYPKKNQALRRSLENHRDRYAGVGIGTSSEELKKNFDISFVKDEVIEEQIFHIIELLPTNPKIKDYFSKLILWVDADTGIPMQQRIEELNGDRTIIQFFKVKINKKIKDKNFEIKFPRDVEYIS